MILKDSSPYNVQWRGARPVFVDVGSFEQLREGEPWAGYRQFCMLFLYPLLLQAWKGLPFQPWLRGRIEGISPQECRSLLSARDRFRRGALTHVVLHSRLERRYETRDRDLKGELKSAGFRKELIVANVKGLERLVSRLEWRVQHAVESERPRLVWDLGCNEGRHARIAAEHADCVVAVDADALVADRLYEALKDEGEERIVPLTIDLADPSPGLGWRGLERRPLLERGRPELTLCLALVHHVTIGGNVPVVEFVDWLRSLDSTLVLEFPTPDDPMVRRLLARKRPGDHPDYEQDWFERCLRERFDVERSEQLAAGTRVLYLARPRA
jgi:hypothetical protein